MSSRLDKSSARGNYKKDPYQKLIRDAVSRSFNINKKIQKENGIKRLHIVCKVCKTTFQEDLDIPKVVAGKLSIYIDPKHDCLPATNTKHNVCCAHVAPAPVVQRQPLVAANPQPLPFPTYHVPVQQYYIPVVPPTPDLTFTNPWDTSYSHPEPAPSDLVYDNVSLYPGFGQQYYQMPMVQQPQVGIHPSPVVVHQPQYRPVVQLPTQPMLIPKKEAFEMALPEQLPIVVPQQPPAAPEPPMAPIEEPLPPSPPAEPEPYINVKAENQDEFLFQISSPLIEFGTDEGYTFQPSDDSFNPWFESM